jgi:hypothetical protein
MASDSRASLGAAGVGGPVPTKGPAGAAVMGPRAAVRDADQDDRRGAAARAGHLRRSQAAASWHASSAPADTDKTTQDTPA